ncbi:MAG: cyclic nucleotide-binding protein [Candidatus Hydrogenedentota bacterium]|nr:MAG: cyclic nucleotide-binding protein [Candidatus Hydrogenedentota bacterium]
MRKVLFILGLLTDQDVERLGRLGSIEKISAGATLIEAGRHPDKVYFILSGIFRVTRNAAVGTEGASEGAVGSKNVVAELRAGEVLGEMSFVQDAPPTETVTAVGEGEVLAIPREDLRAVLESDPAFASRFYQAIAAFLADRLRGTMNRLYGRPTETAGAGDDDSERGTILEEDELDPRVLDRVSRAGERFDRLLKKFRGR